MFQDDYSTLRILSQVYLFQALIYLQIKMLLSIAAYQSRVVTITFIFHLMKLSIVILKAVSFRGTFELNALVFYNQYL